MEQAERRNGKLQLLLVIAFIVGALMISRLIAYSYEPPGKRQAKERALYVSTQTVEPQPHAPRFTATGVVEVPGVIEIVPQVSGRVVEVDDATYAGGQFSADQQLFQIDQRDFRLEIRRLKADVARARTSLDLAKAESEAAIAEWRQLHGEENDVPDLVAKRPQLREAKAGLASAKARLETAALNLERTSVSYPFAGRVLESTIAPGQYVRAGQSYGQVYDRNALEIRASLDDNQLSWLEQAKNPQITIVADFLGKRHRVDGYLKRSASQLDPQTRFATVRIGVDTESSGVVLLPGVFTELTMTGPELSGITLLSPSAMQARGIVWEVDEQQTLRRHEPELVYHGSDYVAVRGLAGPMEVVTSKISGATEGMTVKLADTDDEGEGNNDD